MNASLVPNLRPTWPSVGYVGVVAAIAGAGFAAGSPWIIGLAALVCLPASIAALPCYYVIYGLLALIPGANPGSSSGSGTVAADGTTLTSSASGAAAPWFTPTTLLVGILALTLAAVLNVLLIRLLVARRHRTTHLTPGPTPVGGGS